MKKLILLLLLYLPIVLCAERIELEVHFSEAARSGYSVAPQSLRVPVHSVNILLPADAEVTDYSIEFLSPKPAQTSYDELNPPFLSSAGILDSKTRIESSSHYSYQGQKKWGELNFASFKLKPYQEDSGMFHEAARITVQYSLQAKALGQIPPSFFNPDFFANPQRLQQWYHASDRQDMGIIVISSPELYSAISSWVSFRQSQGFSVYFSNIYDVLQNEMGADDAEKLRNHLISQQVLNPFTYVLLVGDYDLIPIAYLTPEPNGAETVPSDFYYADLSSNWDTDEDGRLGEYYSQDGEEDYTVDYTPEAFVGRFSTNDAAELSQIAARIVAFEQSNAAYKNKALLPAAYLNYENEPELGMPQTDGADFTELIKSTILRNFQSTTLYEQLGVLPSLPSDYPLDYDTLANIIRNEDYGLINWSAHGSPTSASRKIWIEDSNGNQLPDSAEMQWQGLVNVDSFDGVQSENGSVIFASSCHNGYLDYYSPSLAEKALVTKAVAVLAASRTGWYKLGWQNPGWGGLSSYNYHFLENYAEHGYSVGAAHAYANLLHTEYYLFGDPIDTGGIIWPELQNVYTYVLFGDPVLGHSAFLEPEGEILVYSPHYEATAVVNAIRESGDFNVIYSNRLIPDYDYISGFAAVFCLWADEMPASDSFEYNMLNSYLEEGGKMYLEGRLPWDSTDLFLGKFGIEAPLDMLVNIERIQAEDTIWEYTNEDFQTDILVPVSSSATELFHTLNDNYPNATVGILNAAEGYRTIGSSFRLSEVLDEEPGLPEMITLILDQLEVNSAVATADELSPELIPSLKAYPNPMRSSLTISLQRPDKQAETVKIYNLRGQLVKSMMLSSKNGYSVSWDGKDTQNRKVPNGLYFIRCNTQIKKISIVK